MMRGPTYDDDYIARKMNSLQSAPTFSPPSSYNYLQENGFVMEDEPKITTEETYETSSECHTSPIVRHTYLPSARTQLILNRVALNQPRGYTPSPRLPPRMGPPPPYYDYDYGYGYGGYGGGYGGYGGYRPYGGYAYGYAPPPPPPVPRYRGYEPYLDDDYDLSYVPRYRPTRISDTLVDIEKDKLRRSLSPTRTPATTRTTTVTTTSSSLPQSDFMARHFSPAMLQDQVDKMRTRLQAMTFSLDPSGPVPEIIIPERSRRVDGKDFSKKYTSALELQELPRLSARKHHQYPEDEYMKDNLRIKCLSHYKTTRTAAEYWKPKGYYGDELSTYTLPNYASKYSKKTAASDGQAKWEEPDTVYSSLKENKPFSKSGEGDDDELRKDRRKKKRSKERDEPFGVESDAASVSAPEKTVEISSTVTTIEETTAAAVSSACETTTVTAEAPAPISAEEAELDEKEKKRLEKKKRKAEREAAAKAAMEAELAALAEAEAELARLEAESSSAKSDATSKTSTTDVKTIEKPADKCESPIEVQCEVLPEYPPSQFEPEPSSLFPSNPDDTVEESVQGKVEEPEDEPQQKFNEFSQDISAEVIEPEPAVQVNNVQDEPQVTEEVEIEPEKSLIYTDDIEPNVEEETENQLPIYRTEAYLNDEPFEAADTEQAPHKDDLSLPIGGEGEGGGGGEGGEEAGVKEEGGVEEPAEDVYEEVRHRESSPPSSPPQQQEQQQMENTDHEQPLQQDEQAEEQNLILAPEEEHQEHQEQQQQQFDEEEVDIFAGRDE